MKNLKITNLNFYLAVMVVMLHCAYKDFDYSNHKFLEICTNAICIIAAMAVPSFFFLSGFLFYKSVNKISDTIVKIRKRIKTLIIPYVLWNSIFGSCY